MSHPIYPFYSVWYKMASPDPFMYVSVSVGKAYDYLRIIRNCIGLDFAILVQHVDELTYNVLERCENIYNYPTVLREDMIGTN